MKKNHIKISPFTKFEVRSIDCNHVEGFQNLEKLETLYGLGDAIFEWNLGNL